AAFLADVEKPSRYIGGEYHEVRKDQALARVCLAFPDVYEIGMSHLGTKILYATLNGTPGIACERAFSPWMDMEGELRRRSSPSMSIQGEKARSQAMPGVPFSVAYKILVPRWDIPIS